MTNLYLSSSGLHVSGSCNDKRWDAAAMFMQRIGLLKQNDRTPDGTEPRAGETDPPRSDPPVAQPGNPSSIGARIDLMTEQGIRSHCRTPDMALNSMRLDRVINEAQVGAGVFHLLSIQVFAKRDESLLGSVIGQPVQTHPQFMAFVIRDNVAW